MAFNRKGLQALGDLKVDLGMFQFVQVQYMWTT